MAIKELIAASTAAKTSREVDLSMIGSGSNRKTDVVKVVENGLAGAEIIEVQEQYDDDGNFQDVYQDGAQVVLSATHTAVVLESPGIYKFVKGVTAGAVSLFQIT